MKLLFKTSKPDIIQRLKQHDPAAQKLFYEQQSGKLLSVCRSYVKDIYHAEDCLVKAFCKIFKHIESFKNEGSIEGWARKIAVNECLNFLKSHKTIFYLDETQVADTESSDNDEIYTDFDAQDLLDKLPEAYRLVFNLHILEDYSHQEIAEMLNISVSASKTQLFRAKSKLKEIYFQQNLAKNEIQ